MKRIMFIILGVVMLAACSDDVAEERPTVSFIEESVSFLDFTIDFKEAKIKDGVLYLKTLYQNDSYPEEWSFMASATLQPEQNGEVLDELSGVEADPKGSYYYKVSKGTNAPVEFEYNLLSEDEDIVMKIVPTDFENEETKEIIITLN